MIWFIIGIFVGNSLGFILAAILASGGNPDDISDAYHEGYLSAEAKNRHLAFQRMNLGGFDIRLIAKHEKTKETIILDKLVLCDEYNIIGFTNSKLKGHGALSMAYDSKIEDYDITFEVREVK
jgi:hypothetical protein